MIFGQDHLPAHFHVVAPDADAAVEIATLKVIAGELPRGKTGRAALAWAAESHAALAAEWNRLNTFKVCWETMS